MKPKILHIIPSVSAVCDGPSKAIFEMLASFQTRENSNGEIATTNDNRLNLLDFSLNQITLYNGAKSGSFLNFPKSSYRSENSPFQLISQSGCGKISKLQLSASACHFFV